MIVLLSFFHTKIGPSIFYAFPQTQLDKEILERVYDVWTQSFENVKLLNYYFQKHSEWARGKKEMVMASVVINYQISPEIEETVSILCRNFSRKMLLDSDLIRLFIDPIQSRIWFWQGRNTTTEMKIIATEIAYSIRDQYLPIDSLISFVNEGEEPLDFKMMIGLFEKELMDIEKKYLRKRHLHDYGSWWFGIL